MSTLYTTWRKASHSDPNGNCVEISRSLDGMVGVRDSKAGDTGPILEFTHHEWSAFLRALDPTTAIEHGGE